ncbi:MAG: hypothetical protein V4617_15185 [Gemmatimonadota bacterium]
MSIDAAPAEKSAEKSAPGVPFVPGDPRAGRGPAAGAPNAGRPPVAFAESCKGLQRGVVLERVTAVLEDPAKGPKDADWQWCVRWISKYGEKETAKRIEATLDVGPNLLEQMLLDRAAARRNAP